MKKNYHLFSIPIYSTSEKEFEKRLERNVELAQIKNYLGYLVIPKETWLYNQIIGYIRVLLNYPDIRFEIYMPLQCKRYQTFSNRKSYCADWQVTGLHFNIVDKTNEQIRNEIREWLISIKKERFKSRYIDITVFDNIAKYIDFRTLVKEVASGGENPLS